MKPVRFLFIALGVILVLGVVATGLALTPSIQRWAILRATAGQPGLKLTLQSVSAGFSSVSVRGVEFTQHGVTVKLDELDADCSLWALLFSREIEIGRLRAHGLMIDASRISPAKAKAGAAAGPAAAPAALARIELPYAITLGEVEIDGQALLASAPGKSALPAEFKITGGEVAPGKEGTLRLKGRLSDPSPGASVTGLQASLSLQLKQSLRRTFDRVALVALVDADGPQFSGQNQLKLAASLARTSSGEEYTVSVDTVREGRLENVLAVNARLPLGQKTFAGEWKLSARNTQLEPFFLGGAMPKFDARGDGRFAFTTTNSALTVQGGLQVDASGLEALQPELRAIGAVKLRSEFDIAKENGVARLNKLVVALSGEQPVLELTASSAADFNLHERRLLVGGSVPGEVARLKLQGVPLAWVRPFVSGLDVSGGAITGEVVYENAGGQKLTARTVVPIKIDGLTVVRAGRTLLSKAGLTLDAEADFSPEKVQARVKNLSCTTAAGDSVQLRATISAPVAEHPAVTIEASGTADFPKLLAPLLPVGRLQSKGTLDATWQGNRLEVRGLTLEMIDEKKQAFVSIATTRPVVFDLQSLQVAGAESGEVELVRVALGHLPLAAFARFSADWGFSGSLAKGDFILATQAGKLILRSNSPVTLADFFLSRSHRPLLANTSIQASPRLELVNGIVAQVASGDVTIAESAGTSVGKGSVEFTQEGGRGTGAATFAVDLPGLASQPLWANAVPLSAGRASGELRFASAAGVLQLETRATLNGLVTRDTNQTLPVANLSLRVLAQPDGKLSVQAPILIDQAGNRSDVNLAVEGVRHTDGSLELDGKLTGDHVELGDALLLANIFGASLGADDPESAAVQDRALSPPAADAKPFWGGVKGQFLLDVKSVTKGKDWNMRGLNGRLAVTPERAELSKLAAEFSETSKLDAQGTVDFTPGLDPYHLTGNFSLTEFDTGRLFKALDETRAPTLEGLFNVQGRLEGRGLTLADTIDRTRGQFELAGRQGVFRGLKRATDKISLASKAVGLVGSLLGDKSADKIANTTYYVDQLAQNLAEIPYDQLNLKLVRDESLNLQISEVALVAPEVHFLGKGQVKYEAGKTLLEQPLTATLSLRARGKVEESLAKLKVLDGSRDDLGYANSKEAVNIGGSLLRPDPTPFFVRLAAGKLSDLFAPEN